MYFTWTTITTTSKTITTKLIIGYVVDDIKSLMLIYQLQPQSNNNNNNSSSNNETKYCFSCPLIFFHLVLSKLGATTNCKVVLPNSFSTFVKPQVVKKLGRFTIEIKNLRSCAYRVPTNGLSSSLPAWDPFFRPSGYFWASVDPRAQTAGSKQQNLCKIQKMQKIYTSWRILVSWHFIMINRREDTNLIFVIDVFEPFWHNRMLFSVTIRHDVFSVLPYRDAKTYHDLSWRI